MNETLIEAYRATRYLVCVDAVEWADIRIDQRLPSALLPIAGDRPWGFITAWNPQSVRRQDSLNLIAQRALHASVMTLAEARALPAIGIGEKGWHEPSLFVIGPSTLELDRLARQHKQLAYVHGQGTAAACLRLLQP